MEQTKELGTKPIGVLLARFSIPAVIAMLVNAIYNVVDRIFIGQLVGEDALAALTIVFPIMMLTFAFAGLIGIGGASLLAIRLGEKDYKGASHVFGNTVTFGMILNAVIIGIIMMNVEGMLAFLGAEGLVLEYAGDYLSIILVGLIFQMLSFILSNFVRTEGNPMLSMTAMVISAVTNIVLDYVFIGLMDMGVEGAALGTIIGQLIGLVIYLTYYLRGNSSIHLKLVDFIPDVKVLTSIITIGFATFVSTVGTSVAMLLINKSLATYGGAASVTSMGAINSLYTLFIMPVMGITQGIQPIIGYNFGAGQKERVYRTLRMGIIIGSVFSSAVFILMEAFAPVFVTMFLEAGSQTVDVAANGLRIFIAMLPVLSINLMGTTFFQSIAQGKVSMILGLLRQFVFLIPMLFVLPNFFGLNGVWMATPIADGLAVLVTLVVLLKRFKDDKMNPDAFDDRKLALEEM